MSMKEFAEKAAKKFDDGFIDGLRIHFGKMNEELVKEVKDDDGCVIATVTEITWRFPWEK